MRDKCPTCGQPVEHIEGSFAGLLYEAELSDQFFNWRGHDEEGRYDGGYTDEEVRKSAIEFVEENPEFPWTIDKLVADFLDRL